MTAQQLSREEGVMIEAKVNQNVLYVKGCLPHYRRPIEEIAKLRRIIYDDLTEKGVELPLKDVTHLRIAARRHSDGGDISNIIHAVCQAIDGNTLDKSLAILVDDGQLDSITARWYSADHSFKRGHSSMVEPLPSKQKTRGSIPPVRSSFFICGEKITKHDSVADSVSRRADLNCEPSGNPSRNPAEDGLANGSKPQAEWQPISTAPKDGQNILVWGQPEDHPEKLVTFNRAGAHTAHWETIDDAFCLSGGTWVGPFISPTHWKPLPKAPDTGERGACTCKGLPAELSVDSSECPVHAPQASVSAQDPLVILAGIKQFGLAADGSDLRDLESAIKRSSTPVVEPLHPIKDCAQQPPEREEYLSDCIDYLKGKVDRLEAERDTLETAFKHLVVDVQNYEGGA